VIQIFVGYTVKGTSQQSHILALVDVDSLCKMVRFLKAREGVCNVKKHSVLDCGANK